MSFGRELLLQADALAREKNVTRDIVFSALELDNVERARLVPEL
jgi:hypothetical protein